MRSAVLTALQCAIGEVATSSLSNVEKTLILSQLYAAQFVARNGDFGA